MALPVFGRKVRSNMKGKGLRAFTFTRSAKVRRKSIAVGGGRRTTGRQDIIAKGRSAGRARYSSITIAYPSRLSRVVGSSSCGKAVETRRERRYAALKGRPVQKQYKGTSRTRSRSRAGRGPSKRVWRRRCVDAGARVWRCGGRWRDFCRRRVRRTSCP